MEKDSREKERKNKSYGEREEGREEAEETTIRGKRVRKIKNGGEEERKEKRQGQRKKEEGRE